MAEPGPSAEKLEQILKIAVRVPDHGKLAPWRFIVFEGRARAQIGDIFRARWAALNPDHSEDALRFAAGMFMRAPLVVAVVSCAQPHVKIPVWEQQMSAAAVCFSMELAAQALGFDVQWQTDWMAYDAVARAAMGITADENVAGLIYIGKSTVALEDRPRPEVSPLVTVWGA